MADQGVPGGNMGRPVPGSAQNKAGLDFTSLPHSDKILNTWTDFISWERNSAFIRTLAGLCCIAFGFKCALAGAIIVFFLQSPAQIFLDYFDYYFSQAWDKIDTKVKNNLAFFCLYKLKVHHKANNIRKIAIKKKIIIKQHTKGRQ